MSKTTIPAAVLERLPMVLAGIDAFDIRIFAFGLRISAFGDDKQGFMLADSAYCIEIWSNPQRHVPTDKRMRPYIEADRKSVFFNADGGFDGEPEFTTTSYSR